MATVDAPTPIAKRKPITPDLTEKLIAVAVTAMLGALLIAIIRGAGTWDRLPLLVWLHLGTIATALALTPVLMLRRRGTSWHRRLGWVWCIAMFATAVITFFIRDIRDGGLSGIHLFSLLTLVSVPTLILAARAHKVQSHRNSVRGLIIGGLLIAGFFTFFPPRILGSWFFG
jgi:uncharacterized membrane protein